MIKRKKRVKKAVPTAPDLPDNEPPILLPLTEQDYAERLRLRLECLTRATKSTGGLNKAFEALDLLETLAQKTEKTVSTVAEDLTIARTLLRATKG